MSYVMSIESRLDTDCIRLTSRDIFTIREYIDGFCLRNYYRRTSQDFTEQHYERLLKDGEVAFNSEWASLRITLH